MCRRLGFKTLIAATISEYESGKRLPPYLVLLRYARIGGVSTNVLLDDKLHLFPNRKPITRRQAAELSREAIMISGDIDDYLMR
jgi:transcriptional regulator with XRE-family HTH domain